MIARERDHGGGVDAAAARWGGSRADWLDLSTGINPKPYPLDAMPPPDCWSALPDCTASDALEAAARTFWSVPKGAALLAAPGASALIARSPALAAPGSVHIPAPSYNEHAAAFAAQNWQVMTHPPAAPASAEVLVHPNNPDGRFWPSSARPPDRLRILDESFADTDPSRSRIAEAALPRTVILKSFGKFWGLAGLRLGFAIGDPKLIARLADLLGPWPVSGPALEIGARALRDTGWADDTRTRLAADAQRLDALVTRAGGVVVGGTTLFRLYRTQDAAFWQDCLARHRIWSRVFPYDRHWLRLGLPGRRSDWARLAAALETVS